MVEGRTKHAVLEPLAKGGRVWKTRKAWRAEKTRTSRSPDSRCLATEIQQLKASPCLHACLIRVGARTVRGPWGKLTLLGPVRPQTVAESRPEHARD